MNSLRVVLALTVAFLPFAQVSWGEDEEYSLYQPTSVGVPASASPANPEWSHSGADLFWSQGPTNSKSIWVLSAADPANTKIQIVSSASNSRAGVIATSRDGANVIFTYRPDGEGPGMRIGRVDRDAPDVVIDVFTPETLGFDAGRYSLTDASVSVSSPGTSIMLVPVVDWDHPDFSPGQPVTEGVYALQLNVDGSPLGSPVKVAEGDYWDGDPGNGATPFWVLFQRVAISPDGDNMILMWPWVGEQGRIYLVTGGLDIIAGNTSPPSSFDDPRVFRVDPLSNTYPGVNLSPNQEVYSYRARFSADGKFIFYEADLSGTWSEGDGFATSNWKIIVVRVADVLANAPEDREYEILEQLDENQYGQQGYGQGSLISWQSENGIEIGTVKSDVAKSLVGGVLMTDLVNESTSGTDVFIPAGVTFTQGLESVGDVDVVFSVYTEIAPVDAASLVEAGFDSGFVVFRSFEASIGDVELDGGVAEISVSYPEWQVDNETGFTVTLATDAGKALNPVIAKAIADFDFEYIPAEDRVVINLSSIGVSAKRALEKVQALGLKAQGLRMPDVNEAGILAEMEKIVKEITPGKLQFVIGTNSTDSDNDGLSNAFERGYNGSADYDPWPGGLDLDETNPDTDGDGLSDGLEIHLTHTDPLNPLSVVEVPATSPFGLLALTLGLAFGGIAMIGCRPIARRISQL